MNRRILSTICYILITVLGCCVFSFGDVQPGTNTEAEQHFEKANDLRKLSDYEAAIDEFEQVINLAPKSEIALNAQYWIGQSYFEMRQYDAALLAFQKVLDDYPTSSIIQSTKQMIERINQQKENLPFLDAVRKGDIEQVSKFIDEGAKVNYKDIDGFTALYYGISNINMVKLLIKAGADVNASLYWDSTPLEVAVWSSSMDIIRLLVENGARFDIKDKIGWTAFRWAASQGNYETIDFFISHGADISTFHLAACAGDLSRVKEYIEQGKEIDEKDAFGWTPLLWAASCGREGVAEFLIDRGARTDVTLDYTHLGDKDTLLQQATKSGAVKLVERLISMDNSVDLDKLLFLAASFGRINIVELLLQKGADVNISNEDGFTPLHNSVNRSHDYIALLLIAKGANVKAQSKEGLTPLHIAADEASIKLLIEKGADINKRDSIGRTPLHFACMGGRIDLVEFLIANGADIGARDKEDHTPSWYAEMASHTEIIELLREHGAEE